MPKQSFIPKPSPRERRHAEGFNPRNNLLKAPLDSTFGHNALGPLTDDFFPDDERELQSCYTGFHQEEEDGYILIEEISSDDDY